MYTSSSVLVCVSVHVSNDAVGHDRRWHLILMVTPAQGGPCGQALGKENLKGRGGGFGSEGGKGMKRMGK